MTIGLMVVDAWNAPEERWREKYPSLEGDTQAFCGFLDRVCKREREKGGVIIHSPSWASPNSTSEKFRELKLSKQIEIKNGDIMGANIVDDPDKKHLNILCEQICAAGITQLYVCGFHIGLCVHDHLQRVSRATVAQYMIQGSHDLEVGIALNLCMVFPKDSWKTSTGKYRGKYDYYLWQQGGFENIKELKL